MDFIKIATVCPKTKVSDIDYNLKEILNCIKKASISNAKLILFPELSITSYTCADLFLNEALIKGTIDALKKLCEETVKVDSLIVVGAPLLHNSKLYNTAVIIYGGIILGIVPKSFIPNYSEFYEKRWFTDGCSIRDLQIDLPFQQNIPFGTNLIFNSGFAKFGFEICEDLWVTIPPSSYLALMGANIIGNLSASNELVSKCDYRRDLVKSQSARCLSAYIYSSAGVHESTTDLLFSGHLLVAENGSIIKENKRFNQNSEILYSLIDIFKINSERLKNLSFRDASKFTSITPKEINFKFDSLKINKFDRFIDKYPFIPNDENEIVNRCTEIFNIQASALAKRLLHTKITKAVIGISGGLDSTLALLVIIKTFKILNLSNKNIICVTMPGFGTTDRTYKNALSLIDSLNCSLREIDIVDACLKHFRDIGHDKEIHDVTYENVQARERTQILMDLANKESALLIGTGDLSELALGWCTYNGDQMSMYSVNPSIPKTLVKYLVKYAADFESENNVASILFDILNTPISPELLPKDNKGEISQKTEDIVGPYELHDFFLFHFLKNGSSKERLLFLANEAFKDSYSNEEITKWVDLFLKRFFTQQFKRSAMPDGPKVGSISLSPRGDLRMPSDASYNTFLNSKKD